MKAALLLVPGRERMANIWRVAADSGLVALLCELSAVENNVGITKNPVHNGTP